MVEQINLDEIAAEVVFKDIKHLHLRVCPPAGKVKISAPLQMSPSAIRAFAFSKLDWIKHQQLKLRRYERETRREYRDSETHYLWGKRYLLKLIDVHQAPSIDLAHDQMFLRLRPDIGTRIRTAAVPSGYQQSLRVYDELITAAPE